MWKRASPTDGAPLEQEQGGVQRHEREAANPEGSPERSAAEAAEHTDAGRAGTGRAATGRGAPGGRHLLTGSLADQQVALHLEALPVKDLPLVVWELLGGQLIVDRGESLGPLGARLSCRWLAPRAQRC